MITVCLDSIPVIISTIRAIEMICYQGSLGLQCVETLCQSLAPTFGMISPWIFKIHTLGTHSSFTIKNIFYRPIMLNLLNNQV